MLEHFKLGYVEGLFDHNTLANILIKLFVLVRYKDHYFMPALLKIKEDMMSPTNDYFAISFPNYAPMGLFSSLVVCLLSKNKTWITSSSSDVLFRNFVAIIVSDSVEIILLDKRTHFEVHIKFDDLKRNLIAKKKVEVREDVINAINEVKEARNFHYLSYSSKCFCCPKSGTSHHLAEYKYSEDRGYFILQCTESCKPSKAEKRHMQWLGGMLILCLCLYCVVVKRGGVEEMLETTGLYYCRCYVD